jgi:hypothetical protein
MSFLNPFRGTSTKEPSKSKATSGTGVPLELISYDTQTEKFQLGSKALEVLRSVSILSTLQAFTHADIRNTIILMMLSSVVFLYTFAALSHSTNMAELLQQQYDHIQNPSREQSLEASCLTGERTCGCSCCLGKSQTGEEFHS